MGNAYFFLLKWRNNQSNKVLQSTQDRITLYIQAIISHTFGFSEPFWNTGKETEIKVECG